MLDYQTCEVCSHCYQGNCRDICERHRIEVQTYFKRGDIHEMFMRIIGDVL